MLYVLSTCKNMGKNQEESKHFAVTPCMHSCACASSVLLNKIQAFPSAKLMCMRCAEGESLSGLGRSQRICPVRRRSLLGKELLSFTGCICHSHIVVCVYGWEQKWEKRFSVNTNRFESSTSFLIQHECKIRNHSIVYTVCTVFIKLH